MRTSAWIAIALLAAVIAGGLLTGGMMQNLSRRYRAAADELRDLTDREDWPRAEQAVAACLDDWRSRVDALQMLINHDDTDDVTLSLLTLQAAIAAQDRAGCLAACAQLREQALHLYHRDAFTLANVL